MVIRICILLVAALSMAAANDYQGGIERWRHEREVGLKADDGWLTVAGLFWLKDGINAAGSSASNAIRLPRGPAHIGDFDFHDGKTLYRPVDGKSAVLKADSDPGGPAKVVVGEFPIVAIHP